MKYISILTLIWLVHSSIIAQDSTPTKKQTPTTITDSTQIKNEYEIRTLFGQNKDLHHGGFGALVIQYFPSGGNDKNEELFIGGRGGWIINHSFSLGLGGYGLVTNSLHGAKIDSLPDTNVQQGMGYGGLYFEPIFMSNRPIHFTVPILIGAGGASYTRGRDFNYTKTDVYNYSLVSDAFFVFEPGINLEMNITQVFRIALTGKYRFVGGLNLPNTSAQAFNRWTVGLAFKFGSF